MIFIIKLNYNQKIKIVLISVEKLGNPKKIKTINRPKNLNYKNKI